MTEITVPAKEEEKSKKAWRHDEVGGIGPFVSRSSILFLRSILRLRIPAGGKPSATAAAAPSALRPCPWSFGEKVSERERGLSMTKRKALNESLLA